MSLIPKLWTTLNPNVGIEAERDQPIIPRHSEAEGMVSSRPGDPAAAPVSDGAPLFSTDPLE